MRCSPPETPAIPARLQPRRRQTLAELRKLQRRAGSAIMRSLGQDDRMQSTWTDGRDMRAVAEEFIKPNDRLTALERIEIYNRQYWYRLIDCVYEDYPGLLAILGNAKFSRLARAYLNQYPSRSFTLRNLGSRLVEFLTAEPQWAAPHQAIAIDMARLEWAQTVAFDGPAKPPITAEDLAGRDPAKLRLGLQPYISLLELAYPLDDFSLALKKQGMRSEASNAMEESGHAVKERKMPRPGPRKTFVAVHRLDNDLYFKRLEPAAYQLLIALRAGNTLAQACESATKDNPRKVKPQAISEWFAQWMELGWFCK